MKRKKRDWVILLLFFFLVFLLRLPSLSQSVLSNDESLYLLMARSFTEGQPPYTEIWDNKPVGIYLVFSLALLVFGKSVFSIRIIACFAVAITSYLLYRLGSVISNNKVGLLAGILYTLLSLRNGGLSSNTEVFYATFVVCAFSLLFSTVINPTQQIKSNFSLFAIGLVMGLGFQIKQVVVFEFIAILLIVGLHLYSQLGKRSLSELCRSYILLGTGFFLPFLPILLYFTVTGHLNDYLYANFTANVSRISDESISLSTFITSFLIQSRSNLILWVCLLLTPLYWVAFKETAIVEKRNLTYLLIWASMAFLGVCFPKSFLVHYFLQLLPPLCLLSSYVIIKTVWTARETSATRKFLNLALILVVPFLSVLYPYLKVGIKSVYFRYVKGLDNWGDDPAIISKYLRERVKQQDYIYVADYQPIIYYLVPAKIPTRYAFPAFLTTPKLSQVAGIDASQELNSIIKKKPLYILRVKQELRHERFYTELDGYLRKYYVLDKEFPINEYIFEDLEIAVNTVELYKLKNK